MSIYKRGETWWIQITAPNGQRIQRSAGTKIKQQAQELHDRLKFELWRARHVGARERHAWKEAVTRWLIEQKHKKSLDGDKIILRWLHPYLGDKSLDEIDNKIVADLIYIRQKDGISNARINRMLALLRSILNRAKDEWDWLDSTPKIKALPEPKIRVRWLTQEEAARLMAELPEHLEAMARFTLATGLREANVTGLKWNQIDMRRRFAWIHADEAKGKRNIPVPLNDDAAAIIRSQLGKHQEFVFTYKSKPVGVCNAGAWRKALKRAGIENFRWHDLRHTWASWHVQNGTPLHALQELGGWSDYGMVKRYAHLSAEHLSEYAQNVRVTASNVIILRNKKNLETK